LPTLRLGLLLLLITCATAGSARAQGAPPKIGPFAIDIHGVRPRFPADDVQLAASRGLQTAELPGSGLGLHTAASVYLLRWKAVTFGLGGELTVGRAHSAAAPASSGVSTRAVTERFTAVSPQISFNFGDGDGWSYISGGIGPSTWSVVPDGVAAQAPDVQRLQTINYGGGARWFMKRHLAFSFDVRFYAIEPTTAILNRPTGPRTTLLSFGAGISVK
jgi:hypothetical protein